MNGLKYIRTRCNLSLNDLSNILGVTRQALSSWENGKKGIPELRLEQLSSYFGLEAKYFEELTDNDVECLLHKAMFRYELKGKEIYLYRPEQDPTSVEPIWITFMEEREISLEEELAQAKKIKQETLEKVDDIINWTNSPYIMDQINLLKRNSHTYNMINTLMEKNRSLPSKDKVAFFYELRNVFEAMLVAYDLKDENEIVNSEGSIDGLGKEWIMDLSEKIRSRWEEHTERENKGREEYNKKIPAQKVSIKEYKKMTVEEQIEEAEKSFRGDKC